MTPLTSLRPGTCARLVSVGGGGGFRRRLLEMGLLPGTRLRLVREARFGNLLELEVRGCHLSLRRSEASEVLVDTDIQGAASPVCAPSGSCCDGDGPSVPSAQGQPSGV